jgi:hypothetical protein
MNLFLVILVDPGFNEYDYIMIKESYDAIEDLYDKLEQRYQRNQRNQNNVSEIKLGIAQHYYNCLGNLYQINDKKFQPLTKLYGSFQKFYTQDDSKPIFSGGNADKVRTNFYNTMLYNYYNVEDNIRPYEVKFLYDIIYFASIQYRPDVYEEKHETSLIIWRGISYVGWPYVVNKNNWWEDKDHYKIIPDKIGEYSVGSSELGKDMMGFYRKILAKIFNKYKICSFDTIMDIIFDKSDLFCFEYQNNDTITIKKVDMIDIKDESMNTLINIKENTEERKELKKRYINLLQCILFDENYGTKFVRKDKQNSNITNMDLLPNKICNIPMSLLTDQIENDELDPQIFSSTTYHYPSMVLPSTKKNWDVTLLSYWDGTKTDKKKIVYNKQVMDGLHQNVLSSHKNYKNLSKKSFILLIALYNALPYRIGKDKEISETYDKSRTESQTLYTNFEEIPINTTNYIETKYFTKVMMKIEGLNIMLKTLSFEGQTNYDEYKFSLTESQYRDLFNDLKVFNYNAETNRKYNLSEGFDNIIKKIESFNITLTANVLEPFEIVLKTLNMYQPLIDTFGYDKVIKRTESKEDGEDYSDYNETFVQNILLAFCAIFRNKKDIMKDLNTKLQQNTFNNKKRRVVEESKAGEDILKVYHTGLWDSVDASVPFRKDFTPTDFYWSKPFSSTYNPEKLSSNFIKGEEWTEENKITLIKYIWFVSTKIKTAREVLESTSLSKVKTFFKPMRIYFLIIIMSIIFTSLGKNLNEPMKQKILNETASSLDLNKEVEASPKIYIDTSTALANNVSSEVKEKIQTDSHIINFIEKVEAKEEVKINQIIDDVLAIKDTVINSSAPPLKDIPALAPGSTFSLFPEKTPESEEVVNKVVKSRGKYTVFDLLLAAFNPFHPLNSAFAADGRKMIRRSRRQQQKEEKSQGQYYKRSNRRQAKQECKRSKRKLKAMLRRSARIQEQAKKLRKSLKKRRCDGSAAADLSSSCYVYKTAY